MFCRNPYCGRREYKHMHGSCDKNCSTCGDDFPIETDDLEDREDY